MGVFSVFGASAVSADFGEKELNVRGKEPEPRVNELCSNVKEPRENEPEPNEPKFKEPAVSAEKLV